MEYDFVTQRIKQIIQPSGGYLKSREFWKKFIDTGIEKLQKYINFNITLTNLVGNVFILL